MGRNGFDGLVRNAVLLLLSGATPVHAHHSFTVTYDTDTTIVHEDVTVLEWRFINPHPQLIFEAPALDGAPVEWTAQTLAANILARRGFSADTFRPGDVVTIAGQPARNGRPTMNLAELTRSDGTVVDFIALQTPLAPPPTQTLSDVDKRDFTGVWVVIDGPVPPEVQALAPDEAVFVKTFRQRPEMAPGENEGFPLTEKGKAFQARWTTSYDECRPPAGWMGFTAPFPVEFEAPRGGRLHIRVEYLDLERTIWLDGRSHPPLDRVPRSLAGHSVGHWEGDTLVIETRNMLANQVTQNGIYHTENAILRERISREGDTLTIVRVLEDPEHFTQPIASVVQKRFDLEGEVLPYGDCFLQQSVGR